MYAAIIQKRLSNTIDPYLQKTQYGFRRKHGTAQAIHCIRRVAEYGEITKKKLFMLLLDRGNAFDKVKRPGLFSALERMNIPSKYINANKSLYAHPTFKVELDGNTSGSKE